MGHDLSDKWALVTGSSSGIGRGIVLRLAAQGASVIVHGRDKKRTQDVAAEVGAAGGRAIAATGDLTSPEETEALLEVVEANGGVDILVNNAGGRSRGWSSETPWETAPERWLETYRLNVIGAVSTTRRLVPGMIKRGWGRVIHIASAVALHQPPAFADYQAAKAAEINYARSLSRGLAGTGVTANAISVGIIATPDSEAELDKAAASLGLSGKWQEFERQIALEAFRQSVGRIGRVDDIAWAVAYLVSPRADFVTGTNLVIDAGI
jgi:NAD(P)-dependent dehydrogenase (short-subunit alcohol dehydrogenase family)